MLLLLLLFSTTGLSLSLSLSLHCNAHHLQWKKSPPLDSPLRHNWKTWWRGRIGSRPSKGRPIPTTFTRQHGRPVRCSRVRLPAYIRPHAAGHQRLCPVKSARLSNIWRAIRRRRRRTCDVFSFFFLRIAFWYKIGRHSLWRPHNSLVMCVTHTTCPVTTTTMAGNVPDVSNAQLFLSLLSLGLLVSWVEEREEEEEEEEEEEFQ